MNIRSKSVVIVGAIVLLLIVGAVWTYSIPKPTEHRLNLSPPPDPNSGPRENPSDFDKQFLKSIQPEKNQ